MAGTDLAEGVILHDFGLIKVDFLWELINVIIHEQLGEYSVFFKKP